MLDIDYIFGLLFFLVIVLLLHLLLVRPLLERTLLRGWYARQQTNWLVPLHDHDNGVDGARVHPSLATFVRSRYVRQDPLDGTISPLDCRAYLHPFLFTSSGAPRIVAMSPLCRDGPGAAPDPAMVCRGDAYEPSYASTRPLVLREYLTECLSDPKTEWRRLFRDPDQPSSAAVRHVSDLSRYSYKVSFERTAGFIVAEIPTTAGSALAQTTDPRQRPIERLLFEFRDRVTGQIWRFVLPQYTRSSLGRVASSENPQSDDAPDVWGRLPPLWLDRSAARTVRPVHNNNRADLRDQSVVLFSRSSAGDGDGDQVSLSELNPCWNRQLNKFVIGQFPVTAQQFSAIYLRGLQRLSDTDLRDDPAAAAVQSRLYWRCVWDYGRTDSLISDVVDEEEDDASSQNRLAATTTTRPNAAILYNTLLSLQLCAEHLRFDPVARRCA